MSRIERVKCNNCGGDGWYTDHSDRHYSTGNSESCEEAGCPVQRQCEECDGDGYFEYEEEDDNQLKENKTMKFEHLKENFDKFLGLVSRNAFNETISDKDVAIKETYNFAGEELNNVGNKHDWTYKIGLVVLGTSGRTKQLALDKKQFEMLKSIFEQVNENTEEQ